ncbi:protein bric-a-brac 1-like isoform X2 [Planococcus citri]|uniref:protein bric-a-brac 1-like isoform X2 n=1 Tax=Planococcus citri TaxID=170843 RepID=UPI0031F9DC8D
MGGIGPTGAIGGSEQQYALKWNDFHASILNSFRHLRDEEDFIDVTIACDGFSFTAHKVVLSACSPYFRSLLKANPCQHPIVILRDVRKQDMEALLRFMYNGEVHIGQEQLPDFLKTAQTLQVRGLADVSTKDQHKLTSNTSTSIPWSSNLTDDDSQSLHNSTTKLNSVDNPPPSKKLRTSEHQHSDSRYSESPPLNRDSSNDNLDHKPPIADTLLTQTLHEGTTPLNNSNALKTVSEPSSQIHSSNEDSNNSYDDEASDAEGTENGQNSVTDLAQPKLEPPDFALGDRSRNDSLMSPALFDPQRGRNSYGSGLFNIQGIAGLIPGPSGMHNNSQDSYGGGGSGGIGGGGVGGGSCYAGMAEPKPICKECGRVYSSISNLKQHVANVHATSPIWEPCPICGKHFKTKQYLFNHLLQTHGIRQRGNRMQMMPFAASAAAAPQHHAASSSSSSQQLPSHTSGLGMAAGPHSLHMSVTLSSQNSSRAGAGAAIGGGGIAAFGHQMAPVIGPHSPMDSSNTDREVPHQATASISHKDKDMSSAMEQCLQYLSSATK